MKLHWSPRSPFVRKVMIVAHERGIVSRIDCIRTVAATSKPHADLRKDNPWAKIPTRGLDDGTVIYDSPVICEYFDTLGELEDAPKLFPTDHKARLVALRRQALGDGFLDLLVLLRDERMRAQPSDAHLVSAAVRKRAILESLEQEAMELAAAPFRIGHVAIGCALSYLDFRYADDDWREAHPRLAAWHATFAARPSVHSTEPVDDS